MNNAKMLDKINESDTKRFVTMSYDKAELARLANFLRAHNFKCVIESSVYGGIQMHRITITKP